MSIEILLNIPQKSNKSVSVNFEMLKENHEIDQILFYLFIKIQNLLNHAVHYKCRMES